ncbi:MAG: hypothetical protein Q9166_002390 [cf. Caloplaca sp. 2 TL-2023]
MSVEVAQATQEATVDSNAVSNNTPNSHPQPAATESIDPSTSAVSPVTSTFLNSSSTTAQTSPTQETTTNPDQSEQPLADSTTSPPVSPLTQAGVADPIGQEKSSRRGSRGSVKASSTRGSTGSNKLVKKGRTAAPATSSQEKDGEEVTQNTAKPKRRGLSRFFSILNCCGGQKDANDLELDQAVPSKKAKTLQADRGRQTTPVIKINNASAGESSKTESKEALEDKIAGPPYTELTPLAQPKIIEPPKKEAPMTEKPPIHSNVAPLAEPKVAPVPNLTNNQPLPPLPSSTNNNQDTTMTSTQTHDEKPGATTTNGLVEAPIPPTKSDPMIEQGVSKEEATINDRPPHQEARDVEMPDAPSVAPSPEPQAPPPQQLPIQSPPQANLPPPPPPPITDTSRPSAGNRRESNVVAEQQKSLLPPIAAKFKGKKCLVLDLDETLVHSSFKMLHQADFTIPVEIEGQYHNVYVIKRPGVDQFMKRVGELYEDLSQVGRDLRETIIIDNSPTSYIFHPQHAVPISSWFSDAHDNELLDLIPVLEDLAGPQVRDVSLVLDVGL